MRLVSSSLLAAAAVATLLTGCGGGSTTGAPASSSTTMSSSSTSPAPASTSPAATTTSAPVDCGPDSTLSPDEWAQQCGDTEAEPDGDVAVEGSVKTMGRSTTFPDLIKISIVKVTTRPNDGEIANDEAKGKTIVEVTEKYTNTGDTAWEFPAGIDRAAVLLYGANRYTAMGWLNESGLPERLMPGTAAKEVHQFTLDAKDLKELAFTVSPNSQVDGDYTFTDVETLIGD